LAVEARVASSLTPALSRVLVLGADGVVGRALELLLRSADSDVRFLDASYLDELTTLKGVGLVLLCPGFSAARRATLLTLIESTPVTQEIPILELVENPEHVRAGSRRLLPWPCRAEDLKRQINAALLSKSRVDRGEGK
jgi:hypothetical protein